MVLRFEVDQAAAFRQGVDVPKSTNHLDIDPAQLPQEERDLIADRLSGIDVMRLEMQSDSYNMTTGERPNARVERNPGTRVYDNTKGRIVATLPTYEALIAAIRENQAEMETELKKAKQANDLAKSNAKSAARARVEEDLSKLRQSQRASK